MLAGVAILLIGISAPVRPDDDPAAQLRLLTRRIATEPRNAALVLRRGEVHRSLRQWSSALADYARAEALDPAHPGVPLARARLHLARHEAKRALAILDAFLLANPNHPTATLLRARAHERLGRLAVAARDYDAALGAMPAPSPDDVLARTRALVAAERIDDALAGLDAAIARSGALTPFARATIDLELARNRPDRAIARLERLAATTAHPERWIVWQAEILERARHERAAHGAYERALTALERRPAHRRSRAALRRLETSIREGLTRTSNSPEGSS